MTDREKRKSKLAEKFMSAILSNSEVILAIGELKRKPFDCYLDEVANVAFESAEAFLRREEKESKN